MLCGTTESGVRYAVRRGGSAVAYCALSIQCGARDEDGFHSGVAHFTEHTIFKGTSKRSASLISSCLDRLGGELNAFTTKEEIVIHSTVLKEDLSRAINLLLELATSPSFPEKEVEVEKGVVLDEIASYKDSPADDVYDRFEEMLFKGHPLGGNVLGTASSVKKIDSEELRRFVKKFFVPSRMALTIVADKEETRLEKLARRVVGRYFPAVALSPVKFVQIPFQGLSIPFDKTVDKRNHEVNAVLGGVAPSLYEERDRIAAVLLANILGGPGSNSILNRELREKRGWVYGVECSYTQYHDAGIMAINFGCDRENLDKCFRIIIRATERLCGEELSPGRLSAAKRQLVGQLAISSDNGEAQCLGMGKSLLAYGAVASDAEDRMKVESITAAELKAVAGRVFCPSTLCRLVYL